MAAVLSSLLSTARTTAADPNKASEGAQTDVLTKVLDKVPILKEAGFDITKLPRLRVSAKPGPWKDWRKAKTKQVREIGKAGKGITVSVVLTPAKYTDAVHEMVKGLKDAKASLDAVEAGLASGGPAEIAQGYKRLSLRWYEAASGLLRGAVKADTGAPVESLGRRIARVRGGGRLDVHVLTEGGVKYTAPGVAFAAAGGAEYAAMLARDAKTLRASLEAGAVPQPEATREVEGGRGGLILGGLLLLGGGLFLWKRKGKSKR
jgi:hypothetical protein